MKKRKMSFWKNPLVWITFLYLTINSVWIIYRLFWGLSSSFKSHSEFRRNVFSLPGFPWEWSWKNYAVVFDNFYVKVTSTTEGVYYVGILEQLWNTVYYCTMSSVSAVMATCLVAYAVSKFKYKFNEFLIGCYWCSVILPLVGTGGSSMYLFRLFGLYNNLYLFPIISRYSFLSINFLIFRAAFNGISDSYRDAAYIDGASEFTVMFKVIFPQVSSLIFVTVFLGIAGSWDQYSTPLLYLPQAPTLGVGLYQFSQSVQTEVSSITVKLAACVLMSIPTLIFYFLNKKKIVNRMSIGGLKE